MTDEQTTPQGPTRAGFCAIIGAPNAGKSTLVNQLTGSKVSIVSHKVQTTRARIRAIAMEGASQIVLVDTPGPTANDPASFTYQHRRRPMFPMEPMA